MYVVKIKTVDIKGIFFRGGVSFSSVVVFRRHLRFVGVEFFFASFLVVGGMVFLHLLGISSLVVAVGVLAFALCGIFLFYSFS